MAVITVTSSADFGEGTIRQAILDAQSGDTIEFDSSLSNQTITLSNGLWVDKSLTFDGGNAENLTISGGNQSNIFWMGGVDGNLELNVRNLTLADSYYDAEAGGAIFAQENSTVNVDNVDFIGNVSDGGAIHALEGSYVTVNDSDFINNDGASISDKEYATGAISLFAFGELRVTNSRFEGNKGFNGGAIHVTSSDLYVEGSTFVNNDSTPGKNRNNYIPGAGGAIYADAASVPNDDRFYGNLPEHQNQGEAEGGVIFVNNSRFEGNTAAGQGGAMALWGYSQDQVIVSNNTIVDNEVTLNKDNMAQGGGVWLMGYGTVENNTIANNTSQDQGGGLFVWGEVPTTVADSDFSDNQAATGGAIYSDLWDSQLNVDNVDFDSNTASNEGNIIYTNEIAPVYLDSTALNDDSVESINDSFESDDTSNVLDETVTEDFTDSDTDSGNDNADNNIQPVVEDNMDMDSVNETVTEDFTDSDTDSGNDNADNNIQPVVEDNMDSVNETVTEDFADSDANLSNDNAEDTINPPVEYSTDDALYGTQVTEDFAYSDASLGNDNAEDTINPAFEDSTDDALYGTLTEVFAQSDASSDVF